MGKEQIKQLIEETGHLNKIQEDHLPTIVNGIMVQKAIFPEHTIEYCIHNTLSIYFEDSYIVFNDTVVDGFTADKDENDKIRLYTKEEAEEELKEDSEDGISNLNMIPAINYFEGSKAIF
jgi:hypothetical protein